jgi:hypothetical protein
MLPVRAALCRCEAQHLRTLPKRRASVRQDMLPERQVLLWRRQRWHLLQREDGKLLHRHGRGGSHAFHVLHETE